MLTVDTIIDRRILLEARSLRQAGWRVSIVAPNARSGEDQELSDQSSIHTAPAMQRLLGASYRFLRDRAPYREHVGPFVRRIGWRYFMDPERYHLGLFSRHMEKARADVVIAHDLPTLPPAAQLAARLRSALVYDSHELYPEQGFSPFELRRWTSLEAAHIGRCDAVITVNQSVADELTRRYGLGHVDIILNAEQRWTGETAHRHFHKKYRLPDDALVLLLQGGLSAGRNLEDLVLAMPHVKNPRVHLVLMGDGQVKEKLVQLTTAAGAPTKTHFHERLDQEVLLSRTAAADVGVIPYLSTSLNNHISTPNKLFEFIATGLPILASDLPEIRRFVSQWDIGLLADFHGPAAIGAAIDDMFSDPKRLLAWRENQKVAAATLNWDVEGLKYVNIIDRALRNHRAAERL